MEGATNISFGTADDYYLARGDIMLFPPGTSLICRPSKHPAAILLLKIKNRIVLCDNFSLENLLQYGFCAPLYHTHLEAHPVIVSFMEQLVDNISGPMRCTRFMELKITELFYLMRAFYRPDELARVAQPMLSPDAQFMFFIWNNYRKIRNLNEFATLAKCSLSNFKVKFKAATGMSPSRWLSEQRSRNVYHEISRGEKSLKEISEEYHFSSVSHLGSFCRKTFGQSPGEINPRKKKPKK
jgi:AraC-like DNA-binding protein